MSRFFILLLVILMPLKALTASYGMCNQELVTHGQQHETQSTHASHNDAKVKDQAAKLDCSNCSLCHTACGACMMPSSHGLVLINIASQTVRTHFAVNLKARPSDPPYRPKWLALA